MQVLQQVIREREQAQRAQLEREQAIARFEDELTRVVSALSKERQQWMDTAAVKDDHVRVGHSCNVCAGDLTRIQCSRPLTHLLSFCP